MNDLFPALMEALLEFFPEPSKGQEAKAGKSKPWAWKDVFALAAMAGVDPWGYSLREIKWMSDARQMEEWDRLAWLIAHVPRFQKGHQKWQDYNPLRQAERKDSERELADWLKDATKDMPETVSAEEMDRKFEEWAKCQAQAT